MRFWKATVRYRASSGTRRIGSGCGCGTSGLKSRGDNLRAAEFQSGPKQAQARVYEYAARRGQNRTNYSLSLLPVFFSTWRFFTGFNGPLLFITARRCVRIHDDKDSPSSSACIAHSSFSSGLTRILNQSSRFAAVTVTLYSPCYSALQCISIGDTVKVRGIKTRIRLTEQDWNWVYADTAYRWTLQEFARVAGHPWYALQQQSDAGVERQWIGYRYEMDRRAAQLGVTPEVGASTNHGRRAFSPA
jgi:hypothetical protein